MELIELGRYAGRLVQIHNLPQNHLAMLDLARDFVKNKNKDAIEMVYRKYTQNLIRANKDSFYTKRRIYICSCRLFSNRSKSNIMACRGTVETRGVQNTRKNI